MRKYRLISKKGEGTFSEVLKAQNIKDSKYHAIKCMKNHFESVEQVNNLREIQALKRLSPHPHIITLQEVLYDQPSGRLALVFELMEANLYELIKGRKHYLKPELIQSLMYQLVKSLDYIHNKGIFHRDIKPENILIDKNTWLKLADFGSCRGIYSKQPYTEYISTRWYRAPECLLTDGYYGPEMDLWGIGCVFFEITSLYPLFPGSNELDQLNRIHKILGTPSKDILDYFKNKGGASHLDFNSFKKEEGTNIYKLIPHISEEGIDLMSKLLTYDPAKRINAKDALKHPYFKNLRQTDIEAQSQSQSQFQTEIQTQTQTQIQIQTQHEEKPKAVITVQHQNIQDQTQIKNNISIPLPVLKSHNKTIQHNPAEYNTDDDDNTENGNIDSLPAIKNSKVKIKKNNYNGDKKSSNNYKVSLLQNINTASNIYSSKPSNKIKSHTKRKNHKEYNKDGY